MRRKRKNQKKSLPVKRKGKIITAIVFSIVIMIFALGFFSMLSVKRSQTVYEADLTIVEPLAEGFTTPNFSAKRGDVMKIYITNYYSSEGYSLVLMLQGVGVEWQRVASGDTQYSRMFEETASYNLEISINNFDPIEGAEIKLHIKIMLT